MIRRAVRISIFAWCLLLTVPAKAQFINLQLTIEPEIAATVEQPLDFGTQITNSGRTEVQLGDANIGIFKIRAFHTQTLYLDLQYPDALTINRPGVTSKIPLELHISYNNSGTNSPLNSSPIPSNNGMVSIRENTQLEFDNEIWKEMFIYVYGAIEVGNIPNGVYTGDIILSIDYD